MNLSSVFKIGVIGLTSLVFVTSCGPSKEELDKKVLDTAISNVCNCYETNKGDWLAYRKECNQQIESMRILLSDNEESLNKFEEEIELCNKYFKE